MQAYARLLSRAAALCPDEAWELFVKASRFRVRRKAPKHVAWNLFAPTVRVLVRSHIKRRSAAIADIYTQLLAQFPPDDRSERSTWLRSARDQTKDLKDAIRVIGAGASVSVLLPPVASALPKILGFHTKLVRLLAVGSLGYLLLYGAAFALSALRGGFRIKRELFLPDWRVYETATPQPKVGADSDQQNVYAIENRLFDVLKRPKQREPLLDAWPFALLWPAMLAGFGLLELAADQYQGHHQRLFPLGFWVVFGAVALGGHRRRTNSLGDLAKAATFSLTRKRHHVLPQSRERN